MKKFFTLAAFITFCYVTYAQGPQVAANLIADGKITGTVIDSANQKPVEFATVALMQGTSNQPVDGAVCDDKGKFTIKNIAPGNYRIVVSFIGYESKSLPVTVKDGHMELGTIKISVTSEILSEVTVEGQKSIIEERVDRTIYNAENDLTAKGGDASDVLKRVPMLTVDMDGNVSLRGNQNIQVLINNKPSTIVAANVADALKQIPADQIKSVEVITSPSAKYDAEGSAGIINIITKKNNLEGLTLNVDAGVGLRGSNLGLNGNYRKGKMGFSLGGFGRANYNTTGEFRNETITGNTTTIQSANTLNEGLFGNYTVGWDYDITPKNFITSSVRFGVRRFNRFNDDFLTEMYDNGALMNTTLSNITNKDEGRNVDAALTFTHQFAKPQRELSFQGQYSRNNNTNFYSNDFISPEMESRTNDNKSNNQEMTIQADYVTPIGTNQQLEIGGKDIIRKVYSKVLAGFNLGNKNLNYDQNVMAGYLSYTVNFKSGFSVKAGSRYEYTTIDAYTTAENDENENVEIPSYGVLVPSLNISKKLKNNKTIKASYNRRIQRPSIRFLNPNKQIQNEFNYTIGNPDLDPEYTNNFELGYSTFIKGTSLNFTAFARNTTGSIQAVREVDPVQAETVRTTYSNIGTENAYGTSLFANVNIGKLMLNGGGDVYYATLDNNSTMEQYRASNSGWVISGRVFGSYNLNKGWGIQFFGFGRGRNVQLQGYQGNFRMYSLGVRKEFNEKRGSIGVAAENFLSSSIKIKSKTESPQVTQNMVSTLNNMGVRLTFSYRIGKMSMDQRPNRRRSINNDDLKEGGDNGGGGGMDAGGGGAQPQGGGRMGGGAPQGGARPAGNAQAPKPNDKVAPADTTVVVNAEGTWAYTVESPQGGGGNIVIKKDGETYSGTISNNRFNNENPLKDVKVVGNQMSFNYDVNFGGNTNTIMVSGTISGDDFNGNMSVGQFGTFPLNAKRAK